MGQALPLRTGIQRSQPTPMNTWLKSSKRCNNKVLYWLISTPNGYEPLAFAGKRYQVLANPN
jgi:hypothetical protein